MAELLVKALQLRHSEKKVLDNIREHINDTKEIAFITSKDNCQASTFGYVATFSDMLDCETHKNIMSDEIIKHFNENGFAYDNI